MPLLLAHSDVVGRDLVLHLERPPQHEACAAASERVKLGEQLGLTW